MSGVAPGAPGARALTLVRTDPGSLSYQQVNTDPAGRFRITKTYTTDPTRCRTSRE